MPTTKPKKPPACDACKARRVLCHPQPNGAPCPRCAEKDVECTTTPSLRGRRRKNPGASPESLIWLDTASPSVSLDAAQALEKRQGPDLNPSLVAHLFQCFDNDSSVHSRHPLMARISIQTDVRAVSFQLHLLPPERRAVALCIIATGSLVSFHEAILGDGPRPESLTDPIFFSLRRNLLGCGARRVQTHRVLHMEALKAAWDCGAMLQVSKENAVSCLLLDVLEQTDTCGPTRPWAAAYVSHLRALAAEWRTSTVPEREGAEWAGYLMGEVLSATSSRKPILITHSDQLLLSGLEPASAEALLASLDASVRPSDLIVLLLALRPYIFHVTCLARQLWDTITGDNVRLSPLSEVAVIRLLSALSVTHAILTRLLERIDTALLVPVPKTSPAHVNHDLLRKCAMVISTSFAIIALSLHRELEYRERTGTTDESAHIQARMGLLRAQARDMALLGTRALCRAIRQLPPIHFLEIKLSTLRDYAQFALADAEAAPFVSHEQLADLETLAQEIALQGYSLDILASPETALLLSRLEVYLANAQNALNGPIPDMFMPAEEQWILNATAEVGTFW